MKKAPAILCLILAFVSRYGQCQDGIQPLAAMGLTRTLAELLASKPATSLALGSRRLLLESLIGENFASALDRDAAIDEYLDREGEAYYEELANAMEDSIRGRLEAEEGSLFVVVDASAEGNVMHFSFYLHRDLPLSLPIVVESRDGAFRASCSVDCLASLELSAELVVDSDLVVEGDPPDGLKLSLDECSLTLRSSDADEASPVPVKASYSYGGAEAESDEAYVDLNASISWYLNAFDSESEGEDGEPSYLPYAKLAAGEFAWQSASEGSMRFGSAAAGVDDDALTAEGRLQFDYAAADIVSDPAQAELRVFDGEWSSLEPAAVDGD